MPDSALRTCSRCGDRLAPAALGTACAGCMLEASLDFGDEWTGADEPGAERQRVAGYELEEEIAHGGMGVVWRGRQLALGRTVAIKLLLHGRYASAETVERFRREAQSAAALRHPHIVAVHEVGECDGQHFIAMEFVAGQTLAQLLRTGPLPARRAAEIALDIAEAVAHAHERGVLHRDLKPSNILLDADGYVRLTDFGLAKSMDGSSDLTLSGQLLGTPAYLPPETAAGQEAGAAGDGYAIGVVLYEMLSGRPPFLAAALPETLRLIREEEPVALRLLDRALPRDLETIALKCLAKSPAQRFASVAELAAELRRFLAGEPILTRPVGAVERLAKWARRRKQLAALLLVTLLVLLGGIAVLAVANLRIRAAQALTAQKAEENRQQLVRLNVDNGNRLTEAGDAYAALVRHAEALRLDGASSAQSEIHRRRFGAAARSGPRLRQLLLHPAGVLTARLSPNGQMVAAVLEDGRMMVQATDSGAAVPRSPAGRDFRLAWFSADHARVLALTGSHEIRAFDLATGEPIGPVLRTTPTRGAPPSYAAEAVAVSDDGVHFLAPVEGGAQLYRSADSTPVWPAPAGVQRHTHAAFSADGRRIIVSAQQPAFQVRDVATGALIGASDVPIGTGAVSLNRDGTQALVTAGQRLSELSLWDLAPGLTRRWLIEEPGRLIFTARFSPDDRRVAFTTSRGLARLVEAASGARVTDALLHQGTVWDCVFSPNGTQVATFSMDQTARLWDAQTGLPRSPLLRHADVLFGGAFSPDGRLLLTQAKDPALRVWEIGDHSSRLVLRPGSRVTRARFSHRGSLLLSVDGPHLRLWDAATGEPRGVVTAPAEIGDFALSPDDQRVVLACDDGSAQVCDLATGRIVAACQGHRARIHAVEFSPDGELFATAGWDHQARLWHARDASPHSPALWHGGLLRAARFSPDGRKLATASADATVQLWDVATGARLLPPLRHDCALQDVRWSPEGRRLVGAALDSEIASRYAQVWDAQTGTPLGPRLRHLDGVQTAVFDPGGTMIATAGEDHVASIWDATTGRRLTPEMRHSGQIRVARYSPDGTMLLTCGFEGTARVWETATGEPITPVLRHDATVEDGHWHPNGLEVVTASRDGTLRVWDVRPATGSVEELTALAEVLAGLRLDAVAGQVPLLPAEIAARWRAVQAMAR